MGLTQVSTDGVKNDAITKTKIPANQIEASELADNAVDTNAIADQAVALSKLPHGDGSSDGKFLRANNGADPTFETVSSVGGATGVDFNDNVAARFGTGNDFEISHNGSSSIIRDGGSGALTVQNANSEVNLYNNTDNEYLARFINNGANELYYDGSKKLETISNGVQINLTSSDTSGTPDKYLNLYNGNNAVSTMAGIRFAASTAANTDHWIYQKKHSSGNGTDLIIGHGSNERLRFIESGGFTFNGDTAAANALNDYEEGTWTPTVNSGSVSVYVTGTYTKVGRMVTLTVGLFAFSDTTSNNAIIIGGVPFATTATSIGSCWLRRTAGGNLKYISTIGESGASLIALNYDSNGNNMGGNLVHSNFSHATPYMNISITYQTN